MKIAVVDPAAYSLPYDDALCAALARHGHDVTLYTTRFAHGAMPRPQGYAISEWFYRRTIPVLPRRLARALQHPFDLARLRRHLREQAVDVVHVQWLPAGGVDARWARRLDASKVLTLHNSLPRADGRLVPSEHLRAFDAVVSHSSEGAQFTRDRARGVEVWHVPHGALDAYAHVEQPSAPPLDLGDGPVVALAGLLRPYKGVDVLLRAWPLVRERVPDAQLVVAGRSMGVDLPQAPPPGVHILDRFLEAPDFAWIVRRADVVCLPYTSIDLSGVLFTALALGRPLVLSDVGGFREFEGSGAVLAAVGDEHGLADALVRVLIDDGLRERLGDEALAAAHEVYDWDAIATVYDSRYAQLAPHQPTAG